MKFLDRIASLAPQILQPKSAYGQEGAFTYARKGAGLLTPTGETICFLLQILLPFCQLGILTDFCTIIFYFRIQQAK